MKKTIIGMALGLFLFNACAKQESVGCLVGAFLADVPSATMIDDFQKGYGKKPFFVLMFLDWGKFIDDRTIQDVYGRGSVLMVTWEPWDAVHKTGIDYAALLEGRYDEYIRTFALKLKAVGKPVLLRFAHEMNGNWYPWAGQKVGYEEYQKIFKHLHEVFDQVQAENVRWVFSINVENIPKENNYALCYPGDSYVDYIGLDGYNWGVTQSWSKWRSFKEIFFPVYMDVVRRYQKPVIISEFSSTSAGGDKTRWIEEALKEVKRMPEVKALVLFNSDKETDWRFPPVSESGLKLKDGLEDPYFKDVPKESL